MNQCSTLETNSNQARFENEIQTLLGPGRLAAEERARGRLAITACFAWLQHWRGLDAPLHNLVP